MDLTTLANVKAYLPTIKGTDSDAVLARFITAASVWFEKQTGRTILTASYTDTVLGNGSTVYVPRHPYVTAVSGVTVNGVTIPAAVAAGDAGYRLLNGAVYLQGYAFTKGYLVTVTYTAGFATVPADVEQAVLDKIASYYNARLLSGNSGGTYAPRFNSVDIQSVIDSYARIPV